MEDELPRKLYMLFFSRLGIVRYPAWEKRNKKTQDMWREIARVAREYECKSKS
jgi:hypothetical protein